MYKKNGLAVGDFVVVTDNVFSYTSYSCRNLPEEIKSRYIRDLKIPNGKVAKIIYIEKHTVRDFEIYILENIQTKSMCIMDARGFEKFTTIAKYV